MKKIFILLFLVFTNFAQAYSVFTVGNDRWNANVTSHIFAIGYGGEVGLQFLETSMARIRKIQEEYPQDQIVVFWALNSSYQSDRNVLRNVGVNILEANDQSLTDTAIYKYTQALKSIRSFHMVGHSSALYGFGLQKDSRLKVDATKMGHLKNRLTKDAVIVLHGCNTGFYMAPQLSQLLSVPVLGSMTSTDFQNVFEDQEWYHNNPGQYPSTGSWSSSNSISFRSRVSCSSMGCSRMKPNNHPYVGGWGQYFTGLAFYKSFCNFKLSSKGEERCRLGLQQMLRTWPSVQSNNFANTDTYRETVLDFLCPRLAGHSVSQKCRNVLNGTSESFFFGKQMRCHLSGCEFQAIQTQGGNVTFDSPDYGNETLLKEYQLYMGFLQRR